MSLGKTLDWEFKSAEEVQKSYMPFVMGGGIFIRTPEEYMLGEMLLLRLKFPDEDDSLELEGKVVWLTPDPSKITWISTSTTSGEQIFAGAGFQVSGPGEEKFQEKILKFMHGVDAHFLSDTA